MNAISLNVEVVHSRLQQARTDRSAPARTDPDAVLPFMSAARQGLENFHPLHEATIFLGRVPRSDGTDVAVTLKHLATLLVAAAKADGITLAVKGYETSVVTGAPHVGVRLALASGLMALIKEGGGSCTLQTGPETVVRFSHQSATAVNLEPEVTTALAQHGIKARRSSQDLQIVFP